MYDREVAGVAPVDRLRRSAFYELAGTITARDLKVGVWCLVSTTVLPRECCGSFAHHHVRSFEQARGTCDAKVLEYGMGTFAKLRSLVSIAASNRRRGALPEVRVQGARHTGMCHSGAWVPVNVCAQERCVHAAAAAAAAALNRPWRGIPYLGHPAVPTTQPSRCVAAHWPQALYRASPRHCPRSGS